MCAPSRLDAYISVSVRRLSDVVVWWSCVACRRAQALAVLRFQNPMMLSLLELTASVVSDFEVNQSSW
jgi:hypothetical protein